MIPEEISDYVLFAGAAEYVCIPWQKIGSKSTPALRRNSEIWSCNGPNVRLLEQNMDRSATIATTAAMNEEVISICAKP